jgi:ribosome biogenesis SPOUT family RNA methylase Rps3
MPIRKSSPIIIHKAAKDLANPNSSKEEKSLAGGLLSDKPRKKATTKSKSKKS